MQQPGWISDLKTEIPCKSTSHVTQGAFHHQPLIPVLTVVASGYAGALTVKNVRSV